MIDDTSGVAFPFRIDPNTGRVAWAAGSEKIRQNVRIILSTREGERPMLREFGSRVHGLVHDPNDDVLLDLLRTQIREVLLRWEPRIFITAAQVERTEDTLQLRLHYMHTDEPVTDELLVPLR